MTTVDQADQERWFAPLAGGHVGSSWYVDDFYRFHPVHPLVWWQYTKEQFLALGPHYPKPILD